MAEETVQETVVEEPREAQKSDDAMEEERQSHRPSPVIFAGYLLGGWLALMIAFVLIATVAMSIMGSIFS